MNAYQVSDRVTPQQQFLTTMVDYEGQEVFADLPSALSINSEIDVLSHKAVHRPDILLACLQVWKVYPVGSTALKVPWIRLLRERPVIGLVAVGDMEMLQVAGLALVHESRIQFYHELKMSVEQRALRTGRWCVQQELTFGLLMDGSLAYKQMVGNN